MLEIDIDRLIQSIGRNTKRKLPEARFYRSPQPTYVNELGEEIIIQVPFGTGGVTLKNVQEGKTYAVRLTDKLVLFMNNIHVIAYTKEQKNPLCYVTFNSRWVHRIIVFEANTYRIKKNGLLVK